MRKMTTKEIARIGIAAAAVYLSSAFLQIPIPTVIGSTRLHMGNVLCLLSGMLLGSLQGGFAAGIGSMLFDLTSPAYVTSAPFTFAFKFAMAWICGKISFGHFFHTRQRYMAGAIVGSFTYVVLYLSKSFIEQRFFLNIPMEAVMLTTLQKMIVSSINAVVACLVAVPLGMALRPAITR